MHFWRIATRVGAIGSMALIGLGGSSARAAASWVVHPLGGPNCPIHPGPATYFQFNGGVGAHGFHCSENGPHSWTDGHAWYVQQIRKLGPVPCRTGGGMCYQDLVRACSHSAINAAMSPADSPTGRHGCAVYQPSQRFYSIVAPVTHVPIHNAQQPTAHPRPKD